MRRALLAVAAGVALAAGCGGGEETVAPPTRSEPAPTVTTEPTTTETETSTEPAPSAVPMAAMPPGAARICARHAVLAPSCPATVPESRYGIAGPPVGLGAPYAQGGYAVCLKREASECAAAVFNLEGGVPTDDPRRDRPPAFVHFSVYAAKGALDRQFPFELPCTGPVVRNVDRLLAARRKTAACLGEAELGGRDGTLALAPSFPAGGEAGGHVLFFWREGAVSRAATLHAWRPIAETIDALDGAIASVGSG